MASKQRKSKYIPRNPQSPDGAIPGGPRTKRNGTIKSHGTNMGKSLLRKLDKLGIK